MLTDPEDLHCVEGILEAEEGAEEDEAQGGGARAELEGEEVLDVGEDALALFDGAEDRGEVVVG